MNADILKKLEEDGILAYGKIIPREVVEELIGRSCTNIKQDGWSVLGPFLQLKNLVESEKFLTRTTESMPGCLIVYPLEEMPSRAEELLIRATRRLTRVQNALSNADIQCLKADEIRQFTFTAAKLAFGLRSFQSPVSQYA